MSAILGSLAPVFILIMLGYVIRNAFRLKQTFWEKLEWLVYFLLFPSLIVHHLSQFSLTGTEFSIFALALLLSTFLVSGLLLLAQRFMNVGGAAFTSIFMGSTRFNTYIGIAAAGSLYGEPLSSDFQLCSEVSIRDRMVASERLLVGCFCL